MNLLEATVSGLKEEYTDYNNYVKSGFQDFSFGELDEYASDLEILMLGITLIKKAKDRLDKDLDNPDIKAEYDKLNNIIYQLEDIQNNYV